MGSYTELHIEFPNHLVGCVVKSEGQVDFQNTEYEVLGFLVETS